MVAQQILAISNSKVAVLAQMRIEGRYFLLAFSNQNSTHISDSLRLRKRGIQLEFENNFNIQCFRQLLAVTGSFGQNPIFPWVMAGVTTRISFQIVLMFRFGFPEVSRCFDFGDDFARPYS